MKKGFIEIPIIIILAIGVGIGLWYYKFNSPQNTNLVSEEVRTTPTLTPTIEESPTPTLSPTKKPLPTKTPTPKPLVTTVPISGENCTQYVPENGLATVTIKLKEKNGKQLVSNWLAKINHTGSCPGTIPGGSYSYIVPGGTYTWTSPGFHPQKLRIDVNYQATGFGTDIEATSGNHVIEVEVDTY